MIAYFAEVWRDFMDYEPVNFQQLFLSPVAFVERYGNDNTDTAPDKIFGSLKVPKQRQIHRLPLMFSHITLILSFLDRCPQKPKTRFSVASTSQRDFSSVSALNDTIN